MGRDVEATRWVGELLKYMVEFEGKTDTEN